MPVFSMFVGQHGLDAAINDELQPPLAYAELADQDASGPWANVVDPDDQVLPRLQEYETNRARQTWSTSMLLFSCGRPRRPRQPSPRSKLGPGAQRAGAEA